MTTKKRTTKPLTAIEIIEETANAYTIDTLSLDEEEACCFLSPSGNMCAIGRCLKNPNFPNEENVNTGSMTDLIYIAGVYLDEKIDNIDNLLKPKYRGQPTHFWEALQDLHDDKGNWNEKGLSQQGKLKKIELIKEYPGKKNNNPKKKEKKNE